MAKEARSIRMEQETYDALSEYAHERAASLAEAIDALLNNTECDESEQLGFANSIVSNTVDSEIGPSLEQVGSLRP